MMLSELLKVKHPIIMAPMFLVTNVAMMVAASKAGIAPCIPALNFRSVEELGVAIDEIKDKCDGAFGVNLIVNKSNYAYKQQLEVCCDKGVDFIITSLGSPKHTIERAKKNGVKVFCDVTDLNYALKVQQLGADALIAVNAEAGGHAGNIKGNELVRLLVEKCSIPVISAGGVGTREEVDEKLKLGAAGLSIGSLFIASKEAGVSQEYKQACVDYSAKDIVMTTKLSGTPCTVINTPYVQSIGTSQSWFEKFLNRNKRLKKWVKAIVFYRGMKSLEKAAFSTTYKTVWCAGPSIKHVSSILPIQEIVNKLTYETDH